MSTILEAVAIIRAKDATGGVFEQLAGKFKNVADAAKAMEGIKSLGSGFGRDLEKLRATGKEIEQVARSFRSFDAALKSGGPMRASAYFGAINQWKSHTLAALREVRGGLTETEIAQSRFFRGARRLALGGVGLYGGAHVADRGVRAAAHSAADRQRERVRYEQMGFTPTEQADADAMADRLALAYPSISRTEHLADLRKNSSRLGGFDRALEIADVYARARIANSISGGNAHELEQLVRAAEGAGMANTAGQFGAFLNAFARAKAANPDYTGEEFAKDFRAAGAAKYGLSSDFMDVDFPVLASHVPGFGVKLATANSALIGGRATKASKAAMRAAGLLDEKDHLVDTAGYQANPFEWVQRHVRPILESQGVKFGEHMSEDDKRTTSAWVTRTFSAKNAADLVQSLLLDAPLVERARQRRTKDLDQIPDLQTRDAYLAQEAVKKQLADLTTSLLGLQPVIDAMNGFARMVGRGTNWLTEDAQSGGHPGRMVGGAVLGGGAAVGGVLAARGAYQWFTGAGALTGSAAALDSSAAALTAAAARLAAAGGVGSIAENLKPGGSAGGSIWGKVGTGLAAVAPFALPAAAGVGAYFGAEWLNDRSGITRESTRERHKRQAAKYTWYGKYIGDQPGGLFGAPEVSPTMTYGLGGGGSAEPAKAEVIGNATLDVRVAVEQSPDFWAKVDQRVDNKINAFSSTGAVATGTTGSTGRFMPDAGRVP